MPRLRLFVLIIAALLLISLDRAAQPVSATSASDPFELGGQALAFLSPPQMRSAGMTWIKMQITYYRGGGSSTADARNVIDHARRHGFRVLLSIKGYKSELAANPDQYYRDYASFVAAVARLNPDAIEVWNEPNIDFEWPAGLISGSNYTQMLQRAYTAIKGANPSVMVISGAPAPTGYFGGGCAREGCDDKPFIEQMAAAGAAAYFDCTGIHYNEGIVPPSAASGDPRGNSSHYSRYYPTMVSTYRRVFPNKPLCFTEIGYITPDGLGGLPAGMEWGLNNSVREHADWIAQAASIARDSGIVRLMFVWNVDAPFTPSNPFAGWAMIRQGGSCPACATLASVMSSANIAAPVPTAPDNNLFTNVSAAQFAWNGVAGADSYRIEIDDNSDFASPERTASVTDTTYTASPVLPDALYHWRVRGLKDTFTGPWSSTRRLTIDTLPPDAPPLISPISGSSTDNTRPTLSWGASSGAVRYELRYSGSNPPTGLPFSTNATRVQIGTPLVIGAYFWQVRAFDAAGNASAWAAPFAFTIVSRSNAVPERHYFTDGAVTLRWSRVTWATGYQVAVDDVSNFREPLVYTTTTDGDTLELTTPSLPTGVYFWRVRAQRPDGTWGAWSAVDSFRIVVP
jgi:hypothetical protein